MKYKTLLLSGLTLSLLAIAGSAQATLRIFACEPEWGVLAQELGGKQVEVTVATNALQDPHQIQAKPSLISRVRNADLVVCTGADLEIGWLPVLLQQSGNDKVQPGKLGYFTAASYVKMLEVPKILDRSQGDIHPDGNPHIQMDPRNMALVANALGARLQQLDSANAKIYAQNLTSFSERWQQAMARWTEQAAPLKNVAVVSQHKSYVYLYDWLGLKEVAVLEPNPGVEPTVSHLQKVLTTLKNGEARMTLYSAYQSPKPAEWLAKNAGITPVKVPFTVGGSEGAKDLFTLYDDTLARLLAGANIK